MRSIEIPEIPKARGYEIGGTTELWPRYEDISQEGRFILSSLMPGLGAVWRSLASRTEAIDTFRSEGVLPILRRLVFVGEKGPFSVHRPVRGDGEWRLAREHDGDRLFLNMWLRARAPIGTTLGPLPPPDAPDVLAGRVFAEHVITRLFAPPAERRVTRLDAPGLPAIPEDTHAFEDADDLVAGAALEHVRTVTFGLMHTDSNQHVNSLVYPRIFEEALVEHLGKGARPVLSRALEIRWRKPFFCGDRARVSLSVDPVSGDACGAFYPDEDGARPSATLRMRLEPA